MRIFLVLGVIGILGSLHAAADECGEMEVWDVAQQMCAPLAMGGMPMSMLMAHGNGFVTGATETGPRGRTQMAAPNMFMVDVGSSLGDSHYLKLEYMGTVERWTYPMSGYPELVQIGEANSQGIPFVDAQHPHSSPIMGLTLSDTYRFNQASKDNLKISFAPRGESTDGPVAFMHRPTGIINPDAPLGHHVGQDVGHVSSTVLAASIRIGTLTGEASAFNGREPSPDAVDLPMGPLNSYGLRIFDEFSPHWTINASFAHVSNPEPTVAFEDRTSASVMSKHAFGGWTLYNTLIFGWITHMDEATQLASFGEEFLLQGERPRVWGRIEIVQRTSEELNIASPTPDSPLWVEAITLGYTHAVWKTGAAEIGAGGSMTVDFVGGQFREAYGSSTPLTARIFIQMSGMKMWEI